MPDLHHLEAFFSSLWPPVTHPSLPCPPPPEWGPFRRVPPDIISLLGFLRAPCCHLGCHGNRGVSPARASRLSLADGVIVEFQRPLSPGGRCGMTLTRRHTCAETPRALAGQGGAEREVEAPAVTFLSLFIKSDTCVQSPEPLKRGLCK